MLTLLRAGVLRPYGPWKGVRLRVSRWLPPRVLGVAGGLVLVSLCLFAAAITSQGVHFIVFFSVMAYIVVVKIWQLLTDVAREVRPAWIRGCVEARVCPVCGYGLSTREEGVLCAECGWCGEVEDGAG